MTVFPCLSGQRTIAEKIFLRYTLLDEKEIFFMWNRKIQDMILYEDKDIIVCRKPAGIAVQSAGVGRMDLESGLKNHLAEKEPGKIPYLGIIHRLDQPVEGVLVFAGNAQAAKKLNQQMSAGEMEKYYLAVTCGKPPAKEGILEDWLKKDSRTNTSAVVQPGTSGAKKAILSYRVLKSCRKEDGGEKYLLRIRLGTGRHHQIRVQLSHRGMPLVGDRKYGASTEPEGSLGLCAETLRFFHPGTGKPLEFQVKPEGDAFREFMTADK